MVFKMYHVWTGLVWGLLDGHFLWCYALKKNLCSQRFGNRSGDRFDNMFDGAKGAASFFNLFDL